LNRGDIDPQDCDGDVWLDEDQTILLDIDEIMDRDCYACIHAYNIWSDIIDKSGHAYYGKIAFDMLRLLDEVEMFGDIEFFNHLSGAEYDFFLVVKQERSMLIAQRQYIQDQEAKARASKSSDG
jgi:hypothetical protein